MLILVCVYAVSALVVLVFSYFDRRGHQLAKRQYVYVFLGASIPGYNTILAFGIILVVADQAYVVFVGRESNAKGRRRLATDEQGY